MRKPTTIKKQPKKNTKSTMEKRDQERRSRKEVNNREKGRDNDVMVTSKLCT